MPAHSGADLILHGGANVGSVALSARHYGAIVDDFIEPGIAVGHEVVDIGSDQTYDIRPGTSVYLRGQYYLTSRFGLGALGSIAHQRGIPNRLGAYLSAMERW